VPADKKPFDAPGFYDAVSCLYDLLWRITPPSRRCSRAGLESLKDAVHVLEIGPGPGLVFRSLIHGRDLAVGLDRSEAMQRRIQAHARGLQTSTIVIRGHARALPLADNSFDGILAAFALEIRPKTRQLENSPASRISLR